MTVHIHVHVQTYIVHIQALLTHSVYLDSGPDSLAVLIKRSTFITSCIYALFSAATQPQVLYFSNVLNIQCFNESSNATEVVFDNLQYGEALECNLYDHRIYWIDLPGMIKRGHPNNPESVETVSDCTCT